MGFHTESSLVRFRCEGLSSGYWPFIWTCDYFRLDTTLVLNAPLPGRATIKKTNKCNSGAVESQRLLLEGL